MRDELTIVEQRDVLLYEDTITAVRANDGQIYAGLTEMCHALGLDSQGQRQRVTRHQILSEGLGVCKLHTPSGGGQQAYVLRADLVPLWLSGVRVSAVKEEIRPKLERFQREAAKVLWEAFQEGRLTADPDFDALLKSDSEAVQAYQMLQALVKLARNQIMLESQIGRHDQRLDDHNRRLETIEADLGQEDRYITESQATQISQAVRAIALHMSKKSKQNEYGRCWGEFYRKFGVSKYRHLPAAKFDEAIVWLNDWHADLTGEQPF